MVTGEAINYIAGPLLKEAYEERMSNPDAIDPIEFATFCNLRENAIKSSSQQNYQDLASNRQKLPSFSEFKRQFFNRGDVIKIVHDLFCNTIKSTLEIRNVEKMLQNLDAFPVHRTFINVHLHLNYVTISEGEIPARNRFPDNLQLIEASYASTFASNDEGLLKRAHKLNPHLELMTFKNGSLINV